jgi:hypothetical protein
MRRNVLRRNVLRRDVLRRDVLTMGAAFGAAACVPGLVGPPLRTGVGPARAGVGMGTGTGTGTGADAAGADPDRLFQAGQFAAADAGYALLLREDPRDAHGWAQRGYIALLCGRLASAERFLGRALALAPHDAASMQLLADCYLRQDDATRAVPLLRASGDRIDATLYSAVASPYRMSGAGSARLPWRTLDPLPSVTASVNGQETICTLDTGATFTISPATAKAAGITAAATVLVDHGQGPVPAYIGVVDSLRLSGIEISGIPVMWDDSPGQVPGVIGTTIFSRFAAATMDYAGRTLVLDRDRASRPAGAVTAPLWLAPDHFLFSWGGVGHAGPGLVLLDTGGIGLGVVLTSAQAAAAGVVPDRARPMRDLGVTGYPCTAQAALGGRPRSAVPGFVGPILPPADFGFGYLGTFSHELFKPLSVTFDFAAMALYAVLSARGIGREPRPVGQVQICVGPAAAQHIGRAPDPAG